MFQFWGTTGCRIKCHFYKMEHRENTMIFHQMRRRLPIDFMYHQMQNSFGKWLWSWFPVPAFSWGALHEIPSKPHPGNMPRKLRCDFMESCAAEVALQHLLFCSAEVTCIKSCAAESEKLQCNIEKAALRTWRFYLSLSLPLCHFSVPKPAIFQRVCHFVGKQWPLIRSLNASASHYPQGLANIAHSRRFMFQLLSQLVNSKDHITKKNQMCDWPRTVPQCPVL